VKPDELLALQADPAWSALVRLGLDAEAVRTWDPDLLGERRLLVPVDVQALVVPEGDREEFVRLPFALSTPDGQPVEPMPAPFTPGTPRPAGVHLHWAMPDALMRGELADADGGSANRLTMAPLPDRWVVLRLLALAGTGTVHARGWVLDATLGRAVPLEEWPAGAAGRPATGKTVTATELTGSVGGSLSWTGQYDAVTNRMAFHDPLDDLGKVAPDGTHDRLGTYVVAGWWSDPPNDPLDGAQTSTSVHTRLNELGWSLMTDAEGGDEGVLVARLDAERRATLGLPTQQRYAGPEQVLRRATGQQRTTAQPFEPTDLISPHNPWFFDEVGGVSPAVPRWPRSTLLHGSVFGVPVDGRIVVDQRPGTEEIAVAVGAHVDDVAAALVARGVAGDAVEDRRRVERVLSGFTGSLLDRIGTADGLVDIEQHEHAGGFTSFPGGPGAVDRLRPAGEAPLPAGRTARAAARPTGPTVAFSELKGSRIALRAASRTPDQRDIVRDWAGETITPPEVREVVRPAPRFHAPTEPVIAVRGPRRSLRMHHDGASSPDGLLRVRWAEQATTSVQGVIDGRDLLRSLPGGAPAETLRVAREALVTDPYLTPWLAEVAAARRRGADRAALLRRLDAEAVLRHGLSGTYDGSVGPLAAAGGLSRHQGLVLAADFQRQSLVNGVAVAPVGVTDWSQPWVPLWLEWEVELDHTDRLEGWALGPVDLEAEHPRGPRRRRIAGRSPLQAGVATALTTGIDAWLTAEDARDRAGSGEADEDTEDLLDRIGNAIERLDVVSASLDSLHDELLGLPIGDYGVLSARAADGTLTAPAPVADPELLLGGTLQLVRARLVDAFGRVLDLPLDRVLTPARSEVADGAALELPPRLLRPARWLFRLVDPADPAVGSPEASIDQITPANAVNPVAGFLLPDHIDEALEVFDTAGTPVGELRHDAFGGGVVWEIAPGRSGPADAGPLHGLAPGQHPLGHLAAAMVGVDARARDGRVARREQDSALSALLRAVDTTLWSVDTFAGLGSTHVAGLVGRPIAVVRAVLSLEIDDDLDELDLSDPDRRTAREAAYAALADRAFPVRLGELTRADDGLLGFFVDDDYTRFHVVDRVVRDAALDSGHGRGHFGQLGTTPQVPAVRPVDHPYLVAEDELRLHPGQITRLTLLLHPAGRVHLTSGVLPRKALQLARDWVHDGLARIAPSVRVGPVLIEPGEVRLPTVSAFPPDQLWTRRVSPATWRDDPIVAATQAAMLPSMPAGIEEGYIRVDPATGSVTDAGPAVQP
jgi:hypothetical protein